METARRERKAKISEPTDDVMTFLAQSLYSQIGQWVIGGGQFLAGIEAITERLQFQSSRTGREGGEMASMRHFRKFLPLARCEKNTRLTAF